ncbi:hypothetical protein OG896_36795 [Streptomyces sp. NBC_00669]|uniref:hypothetical protein n=1 Tax=Streptomyces sp. NBC_00669 TaxID=2976011 RepID=UPI002E3502D6|nr:hypothetical protein [Streptomyces sp. NBC_00669]
MAIDNTPFTPVRRSPDGGQRRSLGGAEHNTAALGPTGIVLANRSADRADRADRVSRLDRLDRLDRTEGLAPLLSGGYGVRR